MTPPRSDQGFVRMPEHESEAILTRAAEEGVRRALSKISRDGKDAVRTIFEMWSLFECTQ